MTTTATTQVGKSGRGSRSESIGRARARARLVDWAGGATVVVDHASTVFVVAAEYSIKVGEGTPMAEWLRSLNGHRDLSAELAMACACGVDVATAAESITRLLDAGALRLVAPDPVAGIELWGPEAVTQPLAAACREVLPARIAGVVVDWAATARAPRRALEHRSRSLRRHTTRTSVVVLGRRFPNDAEVAFVDELLAVDRTVLVVGCDAGGVRWGPLVRPGTAGCLRCEQVSRARQDPYWINVSRSLVINQHPERDADRTMIGVLAALFVARCESVCRGEPPELIAGASHRAVELFEPVSGHTSRYRITPQVRCSCWWTD